MVVPNAEKLTAVCLACTEPDVVEWIESEGHGIIDVTLQGYAQWRKDTTPYLWAMTT